MVNESLLLELVNDEDTLLLLADSMAGIYDESDENQSWFDILSIAIVDLLFDGK